jgi:NurA-like 5'-3' nuclease
LPEAELLALLALLATLLVTPAMLLDAALVSEARSELRLDAAEPVAVARDELSADDREAMLELAEEEAEEMAEEMEEETLAREEEMPLLTDEASEATEEVAEERALERELATEPTVVS